MMDYDMVRYSKNRRRLPRPELTPFQEAVLEKVLKYQSSRWTALMLGTLQSRVDFAIEALRRKNYLVITPLQHEDISARPQLFN